MTNPSQLPYSPYTAFANNSNQQSTTGTTTNSCSNNTTTSSTKSSTATPTKSSINHQAIGPLSDSHHPHVMANINQMHMNNMNPLYIYNQSINNYPQHHHYHMFQMQQMGHPYPMSQYHKYNNYNPHLPQQPQLTSAFGLNPYDPLHVNSLSALHPQTQILGKSPINIKKEIDFLLSPNNIKQVIKPSMRSINSSSQNVDVKESHKSPNTKKQIVSLPSKFVSAINDDFSEVIGMQEKDSSNKERQQQQQQDEAANDLNHSIELATIASICSDNDDRKWQNEEFIAKRKQQIIDFLHQWDNIYPSTSPQNGEQIHEEKKDEKHYSLPPGLHDKSNGKPLTPTLAQQQQQQQHQNVIKSEGHSFDDDDCSNESIKYVQQSPSYSFCGSYEDAKCLGIRENKWIMLNIQDTDSFTAQWSNPLLWKHKRYELVIRQNFIFFNCMKFDDITIGFINLYNIQNSPSVCIIDPHSNIKRFEFNAPSTAANITKLRKDIMDLLSTFPNPSAFVQSISEKEESEHIKPTKPPIRHKYKVFTTESPRIETLSNSFETQISPMSSPMSSPQVVPIASRRSIGSQSSRSLINTARRKNALKFTSALEISSVSHIYCNPSPITNIWDVHYPFTNLKQDAYILSTRQTFNWSDWMFIMKRCTKIIGAIPSEQHIEFLRNRNGEMTLESSGTYNGWWSEQRIAEYVVNEKFGLSFEGGFASENGRERKKFLKSLELPRRPTFKKMLIIIPEIDQYDKILFHENSLSITPYTEYEKMDNITSFQLWLSFITNLSVNMFQTSELYKNKAFNLNECINFCIKLGSKWKLPLSTLYNDIHSLIDNEECKNLLFSYPKIATDATTSSASNTQHHGGNKLNKYHHLASCDNQKEELSQNVKNPGFEISFLSKSNNSKYYKYDCKRTSYVQSYTDLEHALHSTKSYEVIDFPFPLFSSGWFSFNTLSKFATILEQHLNGTWVSMFSLGTRKSFKQFFDIHKNTRRRNMVYSKILQQQKNEEKNKINYIKLSQQLSSKNKQKLLSFWNENRLYWTDLIIDPCNKSLQKMKNVQIRLSNDDQFEDDECSILHINHNNRQYRKKKKRCRKRSRKSKNKADDESI